MDGGYSHSHDCLLTYEVVSKLATLRAEYRNVESLMSDSKNVTVVRSKLQHINCDFDNLMCLCSFINENETMPGSTSHKIDVIERKNDFKGRVESWLACAELPDSASEAELCVSEPVSSMPASVSVGGVQKSADAGLNDCGELGTGSAKSFVSASCRSSSSRSSRSSRVKESRVKVRLAQLALRHEEERQREEEDLQRRNEARRSEEIRRKEEEEERRRQEADEKRKQAKREKQRQLEMATAELDAWEEESVCGIDVSRKNVASSHSITREIQGHSACDIPPVLVPKPSFDVQRDEPAMLTDTPKRVVDKQGIPNRPSKLEDGMGSIKLPISHRMEKVLGIRFHQAQDDARLLPPKQEQVTGQENHPALHRPHDFPYGGANTSGNYRRAAYAPYSEIGERFLPKPAIEKFEGDPLDYWAFVNRFKVHIADRIWSEDLKLVYLLQHCGKRVQEKVQHYAGGLDKSHCYSMVWRELYDRYGQPHIIA